MVSCVCPIDNALRQEMLLPMVQVMQPAQSKAQSKSLFKKKRLARSGLRRSPHLPEPSFCRN